MQKSLLLEYLIPYVAVKWATCDVYQICLAQVCCFSALKALIRHLGNDHLFMLNLIFSHCGHNSKRAGFMSFIFRDTIGHFVITYCGGFF